MTTPSTAPPPRVPFADRDCTFTDRLQLNSPTAPPPHPPSTLPFQRRRSLNTLSSPSPLSSAHYRKVAQQISMTRSRSRRHATSPVPKCPTPPHYHHEQENDENDGGVINVTVDKHTGCVTMQGEGDNDNHTGKFMRRKSQREIATEWEWDGSMPRRHSSRSFMDRTKTKSKSRSKSKSKAKGNSGGQQHRNCTHNAIADGVGKEEEELAMRRGSVVSSSFRHDATAISVETPRRGEQRHADELKENRKALVAGSSATSNENTNRQQQQLNDENNEWTVVTRSTTSNVVPSHHPSPHVTEQITPHAQAKNTMTTSKGPVVHNAFEALEPAPTEEGDIQDDKTNNDWCDQCVGVGDIVKALVTELRERPDRMTTTASTSTGGGGGWRSVLLGAGGGGGESDREKQVMVENETLNRENKALCDMLDDVRKQVESLTVEPWF